MTFFQIRTSIFAMVALLFGSLSMLPAQDGAGSTLDLIDNLQSRTFAEREKATQQLIAQGKAALRPLARNLAGSSPEIIYRSRKIIRSIAIGGDESTFLKSAAILKLVIFGTLDGHQSDMFLLESEWKDGRTKIAAQKLSDAGAKIELGGQNDFMGISAISYAPVPARMKSMDNAPPRLTQEEFAEKIDEILLGSKDTNRELVFGDSPANENESDEARLRNQLVEQQNWINRRNIININRRMGGLGQIVQGTATFDKNWTGDEELFSQLTQIQGLQTVVLSGIKVSPEQLGVLSRISGLYSVDLRDCEMDEGTFKKLADITSLAQLNLSGFELTEAVLETLTQMESLGSIGLAACELGEDEVKSLTQLKNITQINLTGIDVPTPTMYQFGEFERLRYLSFTGCTFNVDAYRSLERRKPQINISTMAKAFLGVRGPIEFGGDTGFECRISEVIPDSAAAQAGVQIDDVITKINGHDVEQFEDLILHISQFEIGDELKIEVNRKGETLNLSAKLGVRDDSLE